MWGSGRSEKSFLPRGPHGVALILLLGWGLGGAPTALAAGAGVTSTSVAALTSSMAIQPGGPRTVVAQALPNATCTLSADRTAAPSTTSSGLHVISDADGTVAFQFEFKNPNISPPPTQLLFLNCQNDAGDAAIYSVQVTMDPNASPQVVPPPKGYSASGADWRSNDTNRCSVGCSGLPTEARPDSHA